MGGKWARYRPGGSDDGFVDRELEGDVRVRARLTFVLGRAAGITDDGHLLPTCSIYKEISSLKRRKYTHEKYVIEGMSVQYVLIGLRQIGFRPSISTSSTADLAQ